MRAIPPVATHAIVNFFVVDIAPTRLLNVADHRPRARGLQNVTGASPRGSAHLVQRAYVWNVSSVCLPEEDITINQLKPGGHWVHHSNVRVEFDDNFYGTAIGCVHCLDAVP